MKNLSFVVLVLSLALQGAANENSVPFEIKISDSANGSICKLGEECRFTLKANALKTNGIPRDAVVKVTLDNFGERVFSECEWRPADNPVLELKGVLNEPGFLRVKAMARAQPKNARWALGKGNACWSVGYEPERIKPGSARPDDFDAYWEGERARLRRDVPLDIEVKRIDWVSDSEFSISRVSAFTFGGKRVWGFIVEPTDKSAKSYPLHINIPGAGPALCEAHACKFRRKGEINLIVNVHPYEPQRIYDDQKRSYDEQNSRCAKKYGGGDYAVAGGGVIREEFFFHDAILGIDRLVDWVVEHRKNVDHSRIWYSGGSQGGGLGIALCALNKSILRACFFVPALTDLSGYVAGRQSGWPLLVERMNTPQKKEIAKAIAPYFDAAHFAQRIKIPVMVEAAFSDTTCPPPCVYAAYNSLKSSDRAIKNSIGCGHSGSKSNRSEMLDWLRGSCAPSAAKIGAFKPERVVVSADRALPFKGQLFRLGEELARAISRTTGRSCESKREIGANKVAPGTICVGPTAAARAAGFDVSKLPSFGYRIVVTNGVAYILAKTTTACASGISDFASRFLDYHFMTFDGEDPFVFSPDITVADCDFTTVPKIYYRRVYGVDKWRKQPKWRKDWVMRHLLFKTDLIEGDADPAERLSTQTHSCHSQFDYVPPETYFKDHPEYYSLGKDGKRHATRNRRSHLCLTNPDVERIVWSNLVSFVERDRKENPVDYPHIYDFSQMDAAPDFCCCSNCAAVAQKYDALGGRANGGDAGLQLEFANRIARKLKKAYPDLKLRIFAYVSTEIPPKGSIKPEDNIIIWLCDLYTTSDHEVPLTHPANAERFAIVRDWAKIAKNIEIWDYMLYGDQSYLRGGHGDFPEINIDAIASDAKLFRDFGINRFFMEAEYRGQPFHELNLHAMGTLYADPDADLDDVVERYCRIYGAASGKMRDAINFLRSLQLSSPASTTEKLRWHRRDLPWLTVENLERLSKLFSDVAAITDTHGGKRRAHDALASATNKLELLKKSVTGDAEYLFAVDSFSRANLCKVVDDAAAAGAKAMEILHRHPVEVKTPILPKMPILMGIYDWDTKGSVKFKFTPEEFNAFKWYKLGEADVPYAGTLYLSPDWGSTIDLRSCYANGDGLPPEYNRFEIYVSAKFWEGRLYFDQVKLVRKMAVLSK